MSLFCSNSFISDDIYELSICNATIEIYAIPVTVNKEHIVVIGIFRLHTDSIENVTIYFQSFLNIYSIQNAKLGLLAGDMNINLLDIECSNIQDYMSMLYSLNLLPAISKATRFSSDSINPSSSCLDHIWLNKLNLFFLQEHFV